MPHRIFDTVELRCPKLGSRVDFAYCRSVMQPLPCPNAIRCYHSKIPVEAYFRAALEPKTFDMIFQTPQSQKLDEIIEAIMQAKNT